MAAKRNTKEQDPAEIDPRFESVVKAFAKDRSVSRESRKGFGSGALKLNGKIFAMMSSNDKFAVICPEAGSSGGATTSIAHKGASFRGPLSVLELNGSAEWQVRATPLFVAHRRSPHKWPRNAGRTSHESIPWQWQGAI